MKKIDPQINAERQTTRKNRMMEQRYPLLHHAGILEQVAERWTAERHLALQAACRQSLAASMSAAQAQAFASTELYMDVCCELTSEEQMRAWTLRYIHLCLLFVVGIAVCRSNARIRPRH